MAWSYAVPPLRATCLQVTGLAGESRRVYASASGAHGLVLSLWLTSLLDYFDFYFFLKNLSPVYVSVHGFMAGTEAVTVGSFIQSFLIIVHLTRR